MHGVFCLVELKSSLMCRQMWIMNGLTAGLNHNSSEVFDHVDTQPPILKLSLIWLLTICCSTLEKKLQSH